MFTKVIEGALTPLRSRREVGIRILSYLDDWLILAQSREQLGDHRDLVLRHLSQLGLRVNWEKSKLSPVQRISFVGVELDSVSMTARLTEERAQAVLNCLSSFRGRNVVPLKQFQRLLGHMASAAAVTPLGLLHMRPLQHWLHSRGPEVCMALRYTASGYLPAVSPIPQPLDRPCLSTGRCAPRTSVPAYCCHNRCLQHGLGRYMQRAGSLGAPTALAHQLPGAVGSAFSLAAVPATAVGQARASPHRLAAAAVWYINRLGGIRSRRMSQLARHLLLWSHMQFKSLLAVHIPGQLNRAADALSRQLTFPREWRLYPETIRLIWSRFGESQVDLFASPESSHCQLYFSLTEGPLGTDALAHSWPRALRKYAFPPVSLLAQTLCKLREDKEQVLLVAPHWPTRT